MCYLNLSKVGPLSLSPENLVKSEELGITKQNNGWKQKGFKSNKEVDRTILQSPSIMKITKASTHPAYYENGKNNKKYISGFNISTCPACKTTCQGDRMSRLFAVSLINLKHQPINYTHHLPVLR